MDFFSDYANVITVIILVSASIVLAAFALRVACLVASVKSPTFLHAILTIVLICIINIVLYFSLQAARVSPGLGTHLIAPLLATATTIALTVRTAPLSAIIVTVSFVLLCGGVYFSLSILNDIMIARILTG